MKKEYSELIKYLDKKFGKVDKKLDEKAGREDLEKLASKEAVFDLTNRVICVEEKIEGLATKEDMNNLRNSVDNYAKKADTYFQEFVALAAKVDRHEKWIQQIAEKMGIELRA